MSAYLIFTRERTLDGQAMRAYADAAPATLAGHAVKALTFHGAHQDLEGPATEGAVLLEFPDAAAARAWYDGPAYRRVRAHRLRGAIYRVMLIDGGAAVTPPANSDPRS